MITNSTDPFSLLAADHNKVKSLFDEYMAADENKKKEITGKICEELAIHAEAEEKIIYPRIRKISSEADNLIRQSIEEHDEIRKHIREINPAQDMAENNKHMEMMKTAALDHIKKEETQVFPMAESDLKGESLGLAGDILAFKARNKGAEMVEKIRSMMPNK